MGNYAYQIYRFDETGHYSVLASGDAEGKIAKEALQNIIERIDAKTLLQLYQGRYSIKLIRKLNFDKEIHDVPVRTFSIADLLYRMDLPQMRAVRIALDSTYGVSSDTFTFKRFYEWCKKHSAQVNDLTGFGGNWQIKVYNNTTQANILYKRMPVSAITFRENEVVVYQCCGGHVNCNSATHFDMTDEITHTNHSLVWAFKSTDVEASIIEVLRDLLGVAR